MTPSTNTRGGGRSARGVGSRRSSTVPVSGDGDRRQNSIPEQREALTVDGYSVSPRGEAVIRGEVGLSRTLAAVIPRMITEALGGRSRWEPGTHRRGGTVAVRLGRLPADGRCNSFTRPISPVIGRHPAPITCGGRCVSAGRRAPFVTARLQLGGDASRDVSKALHAPASMLHRLTALHARNVAHGGNQCPGKNQRETSFGGAR